MTFDKFFKIAADLTAGKYISDEDDKEFVAKMLELGRQQSPEMTLIDYAKQVARGEQSEI